LNSTICSCGQTCFNEPLVGSFTLC